MDSSKRKNDPEGLKKRIIAAALANFAEFGMQGARMEEIAEKAQTTKRMVVYHFASKEQLYVVVLEQVYQAMREHESGLDLASLPPREAMIRLVEASFDYHTQHPDFMRLVCTENLLRGRYISRSARIKALNKSALDVLEAVLQRGQRDAVFPPVHRYGGCTPADQQHLRASCCKSLHLQHSLHPQRQRGGKHSPQPSVSR